MNRSTAKRLMCGLTFISLLVAVLVFTPQVFAYDENLHTMSDVSGLPTADIRLIIARIIRIVISVLGIVLVILIVYAGYLYMLARGDAEKTKHAWAIIRNAIIGLAIVLASYAIATFVINAILRSAGIGQNVSIDTSGFVEPISGALGAGIIQDHYPPRNGYDIPRNTKIIVTFKEPIFLDSIMKRGSYNFSDDTVGSLNSDNVKIYRTADEEDASLAPEAVNVTFTSDWKTFVFDPVDLLGSPLENQNYTVFLGPEILKLQPDLVTTAAAFPPPFDDGYEWTFMVSTVVDLTPPQVESFIPNGDENFARNILVQINFNEAIDPTSSTGVYTISADDANNFGNIQVRSEDSEAYQLVEGTYVISNGYRTVEFVTFDRCGVNACGGDIFCLPGASDFTVFARSAPLSTEPPQAVFSSNGYEGVVDVAGNSLDGGGLNAAEKDLIASGPPTQINSLEEDNFWFLFSTSNDLNTNRPQISSLVPAMNQPDVNVDQNVEITFTEPMRMSSLTNQYIGMAPRPVHELWYYVTGRNNVSSGTTAILEHALFRDYTAGSPPQYYYPIITNSVTTAYQICFYPAYGPPEDCGVSSASPSCCFGTATSAGQCVIPNASSPSP
jgi:hypothetical protein